MTSNFDKTLTMRLPAWRWVFGYIGSFFISTGFVVIAWSTGTLAMSMFTGMLLIYGWHDARSVHRWRITLSYTDLQVHFPPHRSLTHKVASCHQSFPLDQIESIDTRLEAYSTFGMANVQRSYALRLTNGDLILIGEDRAVGTRLGQDFNTIGAHVSTLCERTQIPLRDYGMAQGKAGFLSVVFATPAPWAAPNLSRNQQNTLWQQATRTGSLALLGSLFVILAVVFLQ